MKRWTFNFLIPVILILLLFSCSQTQYNTKNIILFIGDGMGPVQIETAGIYANGVKGSLSFEQFPVQTTITNFSADNAITDSAAAATAIATGVKVNNGVISKRYPGDGSDIGTILEKLQLMGYKSGLVTTAFMTHATPAAFASHTNSRSNYTDIGSDYFTETRPNLLYGGGANGIDVTLAENNGYSIIMDRNELLGIDFTGISYISGQFGSSHIPFEYDGLGEMPHLSEMTFSALKFLSNSGDGFFLMIEGGRIDHACHNNDIVRSIFETIEFSKSVQIALNWAIFRDDTLIVVTSDHETGGLSLLKDNGRGVLPDVEWATTGHTSAYINLYAYGVGSKKMSIINDNTDLFDIMRDL